MARFNVSGRAAPPLAARGSSRSIAAGRMKSLVTMKITSRTSTTSTKGVTLMLALMSSSSEEGSCMASLRGLGARAGVGVGLQLGEQGADELVGAFDACANPGLEQVECCYGGDRH